MTKVKTDYLRDKDLTSLIQRVEGVIESRLNAGDSIVKVNFFENSQPFLAIIMYSYKQREPQNEYGW